MRFHVGDWIIIDGKSALVMEVARQAGIYQLRMEPPPVNGGWHVASRDYVDRVGQFVSSGWGPPPGKKKEISMSLASLTLSIKSALTPYKSYILALAAFVVLDQLILKGKLRHELVSLAERLCQRLITFLNGLAK